MLMLLRTLAVWLALFALPLNAAFAGTSATSVPASLTKQFTSSTTDVVPGWANGAYVTLQAAGGGGGVNGCGGSSGQALVDVFEKLTPGDTITITIGSGGAAASAGGNTSVSASNFALSTTGGTAGAGAGGTGCTGSFPTTKYAFAMDFTYNANSIAFPGLIGTQQSYTSSASLVCGLYDGSTIAASAGASPGGCSRYGKGGIPTGTTGGTGSGFGSGGGSGVSVGGPGAPGVAFIRYVQ